ncbi:MAG: caspase family protein [Pseudomonadota bacterium]
MLMRTFVRCLCLVALLNIGTAAAAGRTRAVLVGVSEYPNLDKRLWLDGPRNDVALFHQFLLDRSVPATDIQVLSDGSSIAGAGQPTRQAILDALAKATEKSESGDNVFLLFAGHGSQMPAKPDDKDEPDGLDEIFLPRDVGKWSGEIGGLPQAISDNEIGAAITRIRDKGAFVWAIFDNCHSGTMTRSMPAPGEKDRQVRGFDLVDKKDEVAYQAAMKAATDRAVKTRGSSGAPEASSLDNASKASGKGGLVAFYAAQSGEVTPEALLPSYTEGARSHGLFSFTLFQVMSTRPEATYRQTIEQVMLSYQALGKNNPTPMVEGTVLDAPVFRSEIARGPQQWLIEKNGPALRLRAGVLNQVTNDSILAVVPAATSKDSEVLGYVRVSQASTSQSAAVPVEYEGKPAFKMADLAEGRAYARPVDLKVEFTLRVTPPVKSTICSTPSPTLDAAVQELRARKDMAQRVKWVGATDTADVRLCAVGDRILFLDGSGTVDDRPAGRVPGLTIATGNKPVAGQPSLGAKELGLALERVARVKNISQVAAGVTGSTPKISVELKLVRNCQAPGAGTECKADPETIVFTNRPVLRDGDQITAYINNLTSQPVDLTSLYVDASYGITTMYPVEGESARLPPEGKKEFFITINAEPIGAERLLFIAVPTVPQTPETSFVGLAQQGLSMVATRGAPAGTGGFAALFDEAAFGSAGSGTTRGAAPKASPASAQFSSFSWAVTK